ncbi:sugar phosphate isomerase/epimerase [Mesorhizobium sp. RMAD-H1]|uniref:sugar phosphate isomerase/epimerase family protein n=1 Tax=Mesorhizobium sp. RMAD-H1 TaxID=2587065 RepID=UPI001616E7A7|nr:sugar phosphate isomerase/epimerase [Mesorhizobium sp. RMAD-H1]MBB2971636.1 sugar phosphate isomerase/epimerase [Mesorhizobium sp. RMAD-H1]
MTEFSYQLYSSRNFPPLADTLAMLKHAGYRNVEGYGGVYGDLAGLKKGLGDNGLAMPTGHFGIDMLEKEQDRVLEIAQTLGMKAIYCPYLQEEFRPSGAAGWRAFGERLQKAGEPYRKAGYIFGWHNHDFEFQPLPDGSVPQQLIFEAAPDLSWEADIAWIIRGGGDALKWIAAYGDRITAVHVKDIAPVGENADEDGWADVGHGTIDWADIMKALHKTQVEYLIMEHDNPGDAERFATRSLETAKRLWAAAH